MSRRRKPEAEAGGTGCPLWMMTFGDCMSLLVTFFVMLIAFSNMEQAKLVEMIGAMRGALGAVPLPFKDMDDIHSSAARRNISGSRADPKYLSLDELSAMLPSFDVNVKESADDDAAGSDDSFLVRMLDEGLAIILQTDNLFAPGSAELNKEYRALWQMISNFLSERENEIRITAVVPRSARVNSATARTIWGLGLERTQTVNNVLENDYGFAPSRFSLGMRFSDPDKGEDEMEFIEIVIMGRPLMTDIADEDLFLREMW